MHCQSGGTHEESSFDNQIHPWFPPTPQIRAASRMLQKLSRGELPQGHDDHLRHSLPVAAMSDYHRSQRSVRPGANRAVVELLALRYLGQRELCLFSPQELRSASPDPPKAPPLFGNPFRKGKTAVDEADAGMEDMLPLNDGASPGSNRSGSPQPAGGRGPAKRPPAKVLPAGAPPGKRHLEPPPVPK